MRTSKREMTGQSRCLALLVVKARSDRSSMMMTKLTVMAEATAKRTPAGGRTLLAATMTNLLPLRVSINHLLRNHFLRTTSTTYLNTAVFTVAFTIPGAWSSAKARIATSGFAMVRGILRVPQATRPEPSTNNMDHTSSGTWSKAIIKR